jgi:hypothetical protein
MVRTVNGGKTWHELDVFSFPNAAALTAFSFTDQDTGFLFMNLFNLFSPNDSSQLIRVHDFQLTPLFGDSLWMFDYDSLNFNFPDYVNDCKFLSSKVGYAVGNNGIIFKTTDEGNTWMNDYTGDNALFAIDMIDENTGYAVGEEGTILKLGFGTALNSPENFIQELSIFPNPSAEQSLLQFYLSKNAMVQIIIRNSSGKIMEEMSKSLLKGNHSLILKTSSYREGLYMVQMSDGINSISRKIVVAGW